VLGAALLTKASMGLLAIPIGIATLMEKRLWKYAVLTVILTVAIAGWWYMRNIINYGDLFGFNAMFIAWPGQSVNPDGSLNLGVGLRNAPYAYNNLWARFGQGAVSVSAWIYRVFDLMVILAVAGLCVRLLSWWRKRKLTALAIRQSIFIVAFALIWIGSIISAAGVADAGNQGRYLFPGIAAWALLFALGLDTWLNVIPRGLGVGGLVVFLAFVSTYTLFGQFYPAYRARPVPNMDIIESRLGIRYEDTAELLGMTPAEPRASPGETITITLYWRALEPASPTLQVYLHAIDSENVLWRDSVPGNGNRPAHDWQPDEMWAEPYVVTIPEAIAVGTRYILVAGLFDPATGTALEAFDGNKNSLSNTPGIGSLSIVEGGSK
jgi:hypothetical protein